MTICLWALGSVLYVAVAVTCFRFGTSDDLGIALGKPSRAIVAVTDKAFAKGISDLLEGINEEDDI